MKKFFALFWIVFLGALIYIYIFERATFDKMFTYKGPGSPFVNTPYQN